MSKPAVFIDRDGTINVEKNYLHRYEDWEWTPGAIDAIKALNDAGYLVIVVTNQAGIARGMYGDDDVELLHKQVDQELASHGAHVDGYYYCPHHPDHGEIRECECRKPEPGMLFEAQRDHDIDMSLSYMIGDKLSDVEAGMAAQVKSILVTTGYGAESASKLPPGACTAANLSEAVQVILRASQK